MSNKLRKIARHLFRVASLMNTAGHLASGNPKQIAKHLLRKRAHKSLASVINPKPKR